MNQRHFGGKTQRECRNGGNKLSNVRRFSILQSREVLTSFKNVNSANFSGEKKYNEEFRGFYFFTIHEKTLNQIWYSFSNPNLKVCITQFIYILDKKIPLSPTSPTFDK